MHAHSASPQNVTKSCSITFILMFTFHFYWIEAACLDFDLNTNGWIRENCIAHCNQVVELWFIWRFIHYETYSSFHHWISASFSHCYSCGDSYKLSFVHLVMIDICSRRTNVQFISVAANIWTWLTNAQRWTNRWIRGITQFICVTNLAYFHAKHWYASKYNG